MREPAVDWRVTFKRRTVVAAALVGLWAGGVEARLIQLQIFRHDALVTLARRQQMRTVASPAKRGDILDRHGRVLATSVDADSIYAVPSEVGDPEVAATKLCAAFGNCAPREQQALADRLRHQRNFAFVRRQVSPDEAKRVSAANMEGIGFIKESRRFYPNSELAAHVLGFVGTDSVGLGGVEWARDSQIRGKAGAVLVQTDARRHAFSRFERPPTAGASIELTLDAYLQHVAERELHAGVTENRAAGGTAIILNPRTGEILALANEPTFNPNVYREFEESSRRNRAVQDLYEPGSTFKVVTASAALDEHVMPIDTLIDTNPGQIRVDRTRVVRENEGHNYGVLSFADVIVKSSNVGAIKIGFQIGTDRLSQYVRRFGFGRPVSPDFPGESPGIVWDAQKWTESALASVSMGYQVGVTPLQMVAAVGAVANGGEFVEPRVVRAVSRGNRWYGVPPKVVRRAISADTAAELTTIMENVVERGTARAAQIPGYTIAGKTGTAAKLENGRYSKSDYNASFVGFIPSRNPAIAVIVVIDSPHGSARYFGGTVSAPIFKRIAESALRYLGVAPTLNPAPPVLVVRSGGTADVPSAGSTTSAPVVSLVADGQSGTTVPDVLGMSARDAVRTLVTLGLDAHVSGDGFVVSQDPVAGSPLETGAACRLVLERVTRRGPAGTSP